MHNLGKYGGNFNTKLCIVVIEASQVMEANKRNVNNFEDIVKIEK